VKIAFVDPINWDYTPLSPLERPLGGSQSAVCYLARELAARGHEVALVNQIGTPGVYADIHCPGTVAGFTADFLNRFDTVIGVNGAIGQRLRAAGVNVPILLWSQHAADQRAVMPLKETNERVAWDGFILVSDWQAKGYVSTFDIAPERVAILRNAVAPSFEALERGNPPFYRTGEAPLLVYTSTPFRGLTVLLLAFPSIRAAIPGCRLKVFSSMGVYQVPSGQDDYRALYELARTLPGAEYVGSLPQTALAEALSGADILAYPNTFAETSCISAMEAMAAGCLVATTTLGALPETTAGFGILMDAKPDALLMAQEFADLVIRVIRSAREAPDRCEDHLRRQRALTRTAYTWAARAKEWEAALSQVPRRT
jgi:glycosyltransferase involved in cell wall biosynthesis